MSRFGRAVNKSRVEVAGVPLKFAVPNPESCRPVLGFQFKIRTLRRASIQLMSIFRPVVQGNSRYPGLDVLRALAIVLVIMQHMPRALFPEWFLHLKYSGWIGVDLFFVLSGYLIGSQLLRPYTQGARPSAAKFYVRRALRVLPAYLLVVLLYFVVPVFREQPQIASPWRFLTFTQNFGFNVFATGAFSHAWSLCVEEHFYLVLPLIVFLLMRRPGVWKSCAVAIALLALGIAFRFWLWTHYLRPNLDDDQFYVLYWKLIYYPSYARLDGLTIGVAMAAVSIFRPDWWKRFTARGNLLLALGVLILVAAVWIFQDMSSFAASVIEFPMLAAGFGLMVASALSGNSILAKYRVPGATAMATLAYSIYLTHKEVMHMDRELFGRFVQMNGAPVWVIYIPSILLAATILYLCVERPFLKLRESLMSREKQSNVKAAQAAGQA
jgi:peptidoglycan/LPS O-acetylase OafA/YrhL